MGRISPGPTRWPPGAERHLVPAKSNLKAQTSNLKPNRPAERAVQSVICSLRQFLEQRGKGKHSNWITSLPLALWGLNDLPGAVHPYSSHRLVFGREPIGWGDCPPYVDEEGCEDAGVFFRRLVQERDAVRDKLQSIHEREY